MKLEGRGAFVLAVREMPQRECQGSSRPRHGTVLCAAYGGVKSLAREG